MDMERWLLIASTLFAVIAAVQGMISVHRGSRSRWTSCWMIGAILFQTVFLVLRGQQRGACPLADIGEILSYLAWALTLFYLLIGPAYRISLLGVFTAPVVFVFQAAALMPGILDANPQPVAGGNPWHETHAATSVLGYGALALAAVAGVMFLVLDRQLKEQHLKSGLFRNLPPVRDLLISLERLIRMGGGLLTIGITAGFLMPHDKSALGHLIAALLVWLSYVILVTVKRRRGLTGRRFALLAVGLFILSLGVFAFV